MRGPRTLARGLIRWVLRRLYGKNPMEEIREHVRYLGRRLDAAQGQQHRGEQALEQLAAEVASAIANLDELSRTAPHRRDVRAVQDHIEQLLRETGEGFAARDEAHKVVLLGLANSTEAAKSQQHRAQQVLDDRIEQLTHEIHKGLAARDSAHDAVLVRLVDFTDALGHIQDTLAGIDPADEPLAAQMEHLREEVDLVLSALQSDKLAQERLKGAFDALGTSTTKQAAEMNADLLKLQKTQEKAAANSRSLFQETQAHDEQVDATLAELRKGIDNAASKAHLDTVLEQQHRLQSLLVGLQELSATTGETALHQLGGLDLRTDKIHKTLAQLEAWAAGIDELDLKNRIARGERTQAALEGLEAKLESLADGIETARIDTPEFTDQLQRVRARLEHLEHIAQDVATNDAVQKLSAAVEQLDTNHAAATQEVKSNAGLHRSTRDLVRRHLENHHVAGFMPDAWLDAAKDRHLGQRCFLLGSGPSLRDLDVRRLEGQTVMAVNGAAMLEELQPDYFMTVAHVWWNQHIAWLNSQQVGIRRFLPPYVPCSDDNTPTSRLRVSSADEATVCGTQAPIGFSRQAPSLVYLGGTVLFPALQVLHHLGFEEVILLGVDHSYDGLETQKGRMLVDVRKIDHFKDDYYTKSTRVHCDIQAMERGYALAKEAFEADGRRIVNATPGTRLRTFDATDLDDLIGPRKAGTTKRGRAKATRKRTTSKRKSPRTRSGTQRGTKSK